MIEIDDHGSFRRFTQDMKRAADRLQPEVSDSAADSLRVVKQDVISSAGSKLPHRGGLAQEVARMTLTVERKSNGASLTARSTFDIRGIDQGIVVHPVYGHGPMQRQSVKAGFWSDVIKQAESKILAHANKAVERVVKDIS